eukprot:s1312_g10.t1
MRDEMYAQLQKDIENLKAEAFAVQIIAEYCWIKLGRDKTGLTKTGEFVAILLIWAFALHLRSPYFSWKARRKDEKNLQLQKDIENLKTEAPTAKLANFQVDHEKIGQNVNVNVQVLVACAFVIGTLMAMVMARRSDRQTQKVHELPWELHGRMKEQQAIATQKLQGAWRQKAARLEERKRREYKELVELSPVKQTYLIASMQNFAA